ncbi:PIG-L deacetylase family protein [Actinokineospora guangxiensis]|uniref:PIG-L deacetylase family protein n=1 Tax=Actinokineospora guangxiensis TaxID=1490288 RepID=A0ABW0EIB3_9PSEU
MPRPASEPGTVLVLSPHPDDDVIACGGTIAARTAAGARVVVAVVTDGAASHTAVLGIHADPSPAELAEVRRAEATAAAKVLGVSDVRFLGHADTGLAATLPRLREQLLELFAELDPAEVFLPHDVRELHGDHRLTGEVAVACLAELGSAPALRKYVVWDERTEAEFAFTSREPTDAEPAAGERLVAFDITAHRDAKRAALAEHRTQVELYAPGQTRPVVPLAFQRRVLDRAAESFWLSPTELP